MNNDKILEALSLLNEAIESEKNSGVLRYKLIDHEEDQYEIQGDSIGLVKHGIDFINAAVSEGKLDVKENCELYNSTSIKIVTNDSDVFIAEISKYHNVPPACNVEENQSIWLKLLGWLFFIILITIITLVGIGLYTVVKWIF